MREPSAQMIAVEEDFASLNTSLPTELPLLSPPIPPFGIRLNMLDACAMLDSEDQIAPFKNAHRVLMFFWDLDTLREETAPEEESVITPKVFASASLDTSELDVNSRLSSDRLSDIGLGRLFPSVLI